MFESFRTGASALLLLFVSWHRLPRSPTTADGFSFHPRTPIAVRTSAARQELTRTQPTARRRLTTEGRSILLALSATKRRETAATLTALSSASTIVESRSSTASTTPAKRRGSGGGSGKSGNGGTDMARGAALLLESVSVWRGPSPILTNIDWRVEPNSKWGLVGANGAGKSTLLQAVVGKIPIEAGEGFVALGIPRQQPQQDSDDGDACDDRIGYLEQTAVAGSQLTVYEEAASGMKLLNRARRDMEDAMNRQDLDAIDTATVRFEALGGYQQEQKVSAVLRGLGFANLEQRCDELSGGWQMRVALARLLLSEPALCLLDEPGNHLDAAAKKWLAQYLAGYDGRGALVLVTHDASLLQSMQHIAELVPRSSGGGSTLQLYKSCTHEQYLQLKVERAEAARTEYAKNVDKAAKLQAFVDRFGASATKASAAQSRVKQIEKMKEQGLLDAPPEEVVAARFKPTLVLADPPKVMGDVLLRLEDAQIGRSQDKILVSRVDLEITRGMRLLIRGPNGAGKSTLLHTLRGALPLLGGVRHENEQLRLGMFTQDLAQELDPSERAVDVVTSYARHGPDGDVTVSSEKARSALGRLGLTGEKSLRRIRDLSGGEKARVCLAMFALKPSNLYLLDEASNHLDVECVECLSSALSEWGGREDDDNNAKSRSGAFVVVSHDRHFCQQLSFTHVATVEEGRFTMEQRDARESDWSISGMSIGASSAATSVDGSSKAAALVAPKASSATTPMDEKRRKQAFNAPKRVAKIEGLVASLEAKISSIDSEMLSIGSDLGRLVDLSKEKQALEAQVATLMNEWEELERLLASIAA